ncbi:hypothetical protein [Bacillus sp. FJAT-28004]|uniref:hypothetical protein n=1 Tax=Bacillus sp. FJAT-28004 TaxID=1679165 RepID=UPI0006B4BD5E|nr:hypothetical protein [Bacillus sp. FJAT-28004]
MTVMNDEREHAGKITFQCSDQRLNDGFNWAREQAMAYAHFGEDAVGLWYEAALPARSAFCMRDVAHHSMGAAALGLAPHTLNMMLKFGKYISLTRDWCTYWEITKDDEPAEVDYADDQDFWYNLPSNFDIIFACWRQYMWTGDRTYLDHPVLQNFYDKTVTEYVKTWDKDGDGILEYYPEYGRRGLASYNEVGLQPLAGGDMVAAQIAGYRAYSHMKMLLSDPAASAHYEQLAAQLEQKYEQQWWNEETASFYGSLLQDRTYNTNHQAEANFLPLYFEAVQDLRKRTAALADMHSRGVANVEAKTYMPDIYYPYEQHEYGLQELLELVDPKLDRREYPEVSYCVVGSIATGLMGVSANGQDMITTVSRLSPHLDWAELTELPILGCTIAVKHFGYETTELCNDGQDRVLWKAVFAGEHTQLLHNGVLIPAEQEFDVNGCIRSYAVIAAGSGEHHNVSVQ